MRLCSRCNQNPKLDNHPAYCRECRNDYSREWRRKNPGRRSPTDPEKARAWASARRKRNREYVIAYKRDRPCVDCGGRFHPAAMQFDHNGSDKQFCVSRGAGQTMGLERLQAEMDKCELVCANCHAVRTWG